MNPQRIAALALVLALALDAPVGAVARPPRDLEVSFSHGQTTLAGTLSLPAGDGRVVPVAVLISGDGPQDRDGGPGGAALPRFIARRLVEEGVAVLRHDDRDAGHSSRSAAPPSYRAAVGDTRAAIASVRARPELDPRRVILVGHSEGAKTAAVLAAEDPGIAAIALLAGATAVNVDTLLLEQARSASSEHAARLLSVVQAARAGARASGADDLTDWMREHLEIAPREVLARVRCPVLILQGERDHLVAAHHAADAAAVLRAGGNQRVRVRTFRGLSHVFNRSIPGVPPSSSSQRIDPAVLQALATWVREAVGDAVAREGK